VVHRALALRNRHPEAFGPGEAGRYIPLLGSGRAAAHLVAFSRGDEVIPMATRLPVALQRNGGWGDTTVTLPPGRWKNHLGGDQPHDEQWRGSVPLGHLLPGVPVALLTKEGP
jgi:(1->4)-alpha-D-glucan 1-alpha-D-glucosylmutase